MRPGGKLTAHTYADESSAGGDATTATFSYDDRGLPEGAGWNAPSGGPVSVAYQTRNVAGLVTRRAAAPPLSVSRELTSDWSYDPLSRVTSLTISDRQYFPTSTTELAEQVIDYLGQDDPSALRHRIGGSDYVFSFDYDRRHQLISVDEADDRFAASYSFSVGGKLESVVVAGAASPANGEDVISRNVSYVYPAQPWSLVDPEAVVALEQSGGGNFREYDYDSVGNMISRVAPSSTSETFAYDGEDQLRRAVMTGATDGSEEYFYDHSGQRIAVVTRDDQGVATKARVFLGDTQLEFDTNGDLVRSDAHLSLGTPVARIKDREVLEFQYHGLSNNTLLTLAADGTVNTGFVYAPYGEVIETLGPNKGLAAQHRRFNDKFQDDLTSLSYYGARYYDRHLLGWTQADPKYRFAPDSAWDQPRRADLYTFSNSNPLRYYDPDGRDGREGMDWLDAVSVLGGPVTIWSTANLVRDAVTGRQSGVDLAVNAIPGRPGDVAALGASAYYFAKGQPEKGMLFLAMAAIPGAADKMLPRVASVLGKGVSRAAGPLSLTEIAATIRMAGDSSQAVNRKTVAVGIGADGKMYVTLSAPLDAKQAQEALRHGATIIPAEKTLVNGQLKNQHAEQTLLKNVTVDGSIGVSKRAPCGPDEQNCQAAIEAAGTSVVGGDRGTYAR